MSWWLVAEPTPCLYIRSAQHSADMDSEMAILAIEAGATRSAWMNHVLNRTAGVPASMPKGAFELVCAGGVVSIANYEVLEFS